MSTLIEQLRAEASYLGNNIVKVDGVVNHQIHPFTMNWAGREFVRRLESAGVAAPTRILTAETSGIAPAFATAYAFGIPLVFARKRQPITMTDPPLTATAPSRTGDGLVTLRVSGEYLSNTDQVVIIDDFLGSGRTLVALADIVHAAGARLLGIGCLIEKTFEDHDPRLAELDVPVISLARCVLENGRVDFIDPADC